MNYLLLQNEPCIKDFSVEIASKFPSSSVKHIYQENFPKALPPLTEKWILFIHLRGSNCSKQIEQAKNTEPIANLVFITSDCSGTIAKLLNDIEISFQILDNLRVKEEEMIYFVQKRLGVSSNLAKVIVSRSNRYEPDVIRNTNLLTCVRKGKLTRADVNTYLVDSNFVNLFYLYDYLVAGEGGYQQAVQIVYQAQFGVKGICGFLLKRLEEDIHYFHEILDGNLTNENYAVYAEEHRLPYRRLQQALILFRKVTLESLYGKKLLFQTLRNSNYIEFIRKGCWH